MARVFSQKKEIPADVLVNTLWVSTGLAVVLTVPSILIFMFFFLNFDNIVAGAVIGISKLIGYEVRNISATAFAVEQKIPVETTMSKLILSEE